MATASPSPPQTSRGALWFGFTGGGIAWLLHLLLAYGAGEFGCLSPLRDMLFLGITGVAWLILIVSVITLVIAVAATVTALRAWRCLRRGPPASDQRQAELYFARAGLIASALFIFIILVESIPVFYYLSDC